MNRAKLLKLGTQSKALQKEKSKMSIEECRELLSEEEGVEYTLEEVQHIRDFVYVLSEIIIMHYEREKRKQETSAIKIINLEHYERETISHSLHQGQHRRAS